MVLVVQIKTARELGALIREQRTQCNWTQEELASRVGVSRLWIVQVEKGKPTAQIGLVLRTLKELSVALDVSAALPAGWPRAGTSTVDLDQIIQKTLT